MTAPLLSLRGVACRRGGRLLFEDIDLTLAAGDAAIVSGQNGAGKSSLLRIAAGLLRPIAGEVHRTPRLAFADERHALDDGAPLAVALEQWAQLDRRPAARLKNLGLDDLDHVPVRLLSTGQRRRAALARIIGTGASLWILDEPDSGLDADGVRMLQGLIDGHRAAGGAALVATHSALAIGDAARMQL